MSHPLGHCARRSLRQPPTVFQRQCRAQSRFRSSIQNPSPESAFSATSTSSMRARPYQDGQRIQTGEYGGYGQSQKRTLFTTASMMASTEPRRGSDVNRIRRFSQSARKLAMPSTVAVEAEGGGGGGIDATTATNTIILQNPQLDEDGNEMRIDISDRAARRLEQIIASSRQSTTTTTTPAAAAAAASKIPPTPSPSTTSPNYNHLRISVTSGGCHGFQYLISLEPATAIESDMDTIFAAPSTTTKTGQISPPAPTAKVILDESSLSLLKGSTVDYTSELIGSQFTIRGNPRAKSSCGCGTSFDIED